MGISSADDFLKFYESALQDYRNNNPEMALQKQQELKRYSPDWPKLYLLEAYIYRDMQMYVSEERALMKVLELLKKQEAPESALAADVWSMLGSMWLSTGKPVKAVEALLHSAGLEKGTPEQCVEYSNAIFAANSIADYGSEDFQALYSGYRALFSEVTPYAPRKYKHKRVRVGYLSSDLKNHPVAHFILPLLKEHDRNDFSVYCYGANASEDSVTTELRQYADEWRRVEKLQPAEIAELIHDDEIDILMELNGHTKDTRLPVLAWHPATVQISGIGYMNSTGLYATDYFLSDAVCSGDMAAAREFFTEKMLVLPHSHFCYSPIGEFPDCGTAPCLRNGYITFGCFNNFSKVTDEMLKLWGCILEEVPDSRLILKHRLFNQGEGRSLTINRMADLGLPVERVELRTFSSEYLKEYRDIDIALDTYPYTGGLTTCEALYMGVPVISLYGRRHGTRFGMSLLKNAGFGELAVASADRYKALAVELANDVELLGALRCSLRGNMEQSSLMNGRQYTLEVEQAYRNILKAVEV